MNDWQEYPFAHVSSDGTHDAPVRKVDDRENVSNTFAWPFGITSSQDMYMATTAVGWPSGAQFALDSMSTPTQAMFSTSPSQASGAFSTSTMSASRAEGLCPTTSYPSIAQQKAYQYSCFTPPISCSSFTAWDPLQNTTSVLRPMEASSPGQSSQASTIESSPYAHSDGYFGAQTPPFIKVEDCLDVETNRLYSVPGTTSRARPSHVNPEDIFSKPYSIVPSQASTPMTRSPKPEYCEDSKPTHHDQEPYLDDYPPFRTDGALGIDNHIKRGYTTSATSKCHCIKCGKLFQRTYNLKAHMETHDPQRQQPHMCAYPECKRKFVRKTDLVRHEQSVHIKSRNFSCPLCHNSFARKDTLRRHIDDGCPRRPEVRQRLERARRASNSRPDPSRQQYGGIMIPTSPSGR